MTESKTDSESDSSREYTWSPSTSCLEEEARSENSLSDFLFRNARYSLVPEMQSRYTQTDVTIWAESLSVLVYYVLVLCFHIEGFYLWISISIHNHWNILYVCSI